MNREDARGILEKVAQDLKRQSWWQNDTYRLLTFEQPEGDFIHTQVLFVMTYGLLRISLIAPSYPKSDVYLEFVEILGKKYMPTPTQKSVTPGQILTILSKYMPPVEEIRSFETQVRTQLERLQMSAEIRQRVEVASWWHKLLEFSPGMDSG